MTIVFAVALLVVLGIMGRNWIVQRNAQKEYEKLAAQVNRLQDEANENAIMLPSDTEETEMPVETEETSSEEDSLTMLGIEAPEKKKKGLMAKLRSKAAEAQKELDAEKKASGKKKK